MKAYCLFEQSGTFKNEFKKLGYEAYDFDILNDFNETDYQIDLFQEIETAFNGGGTLFDKITPNDIILAFFPCVRFEGQIIMHFKGTYYGSDKHTLERKLLTDLELIAELKRNYELITKLVLICLRKGLKLIVENPYSTQHFLHRYWALEPKFIDVDRTQRGDYFKKPTQYFFVNCEPKYNLILEPVNLKSEKRNVINCNQVERSMISEDYANRFIKEFILQREK